MGLVEFHKRFDEEKIIIKNKIINRDIGNLLYAVIEYSQKIIIPTKIFKSWSGKSNVFQYLGVHYVDLIYFMTNFKPIKVHALGQKEILIKRNINTWDSIQVIIEWKKPNGKVFVSTHVTNWVESNNSSAMSDQKISIVGTTGKIVSDQKNRGLQVINDKDKIQDINPYFSNINYQTKKIENLFFGYGIASINNFVDCVDKIINAKISYKAFIKNNSTFIDGLVSTAVLEAVKKSLISKKSEKVICINMSNFKNSKPLISIIIRTKTKKRWIKICLNRIFEQTYKKFELIIVDNFSTDNTLQKIKSYKISKIIKIKKFLPGKAINMGAKIAEGKYLIILSAHCIPTNNFWLENYIKLISSYEKKVKNIAGIYGRQEPMSSTPSNDRRDLHLLFGLDTKIQKKDSFFHNANSLLWFVQFGKNLILMKKLKILKIGSGLRKF